MSELSPESRRWIVGLFVLLLAFAPLAWFYPPSAGFPLAAIFVAGYRIQLRRWWASRAWFDLITLVVETVRADCPSVVFADPR